MVSFSSSTPGHKGRTQLGDHVLIHPRLAISVGGAEKEGARISKMSRGVTKGFPVSLIVSPSRTGRQVLKRGLAEEEYRSSEPSELV